MAKIGNEMKALYEKPPLHLLIIPLPKSHAPPLFKFAKLLADEGITITFLILEDDLASMKLSPEELQRPGFNVVGLALMGGSSEDSVLQDAITVSKAPIIEFLARTKRAFEPYLEKLLADQLAGVPRPTCMMADVFLEWTEDVASKLGIPRYLFSPSGAVFGRLLQASPDLFSQGVLQVRANKLIKTSETVGTTGLPPLHFGDLPMSLISAPSTFNKVGQALMTPDHGVRGLVVNSVYELEASAIDAFRATTKVPKVFPVGPLATTPMTVDTAKAVTDNDCLLWLDSQPAASVIYICFGTMFRLSLQHMYQLAVAFESITTLGFLWALPETQFVSTSLEETFPPDFQARVGGRGKIAIGWVPQVEILAHPSIGGFLSHCGWNSSLESMTLGVPILAWPMGAEQFLNCRYLVDVVKVAMVVNRGFDDSVDQQELEDILRLFMLADEGKAMRKRAGELKLMTREAVAAPTGSSYLAFRNLVDELKSL